MKKEIVQFLTDEEDEAVDILISLGFAKRVAIALVFLRKTDEATSREIARGADLTTSDVSLAMQYLAGRQWIEIREETRPKGRYHYVYRLALPFPEIVEIVLREKHENLEVHLARLRKMKKETGSPQQ